MPSREANPNKKFSIGETVIYLPFGKHLRDRVRVTNTKFFISGWRYEITFADGMTVWVPASKLKRITINDMLGLRRLR